jgi:hypothetical protein
MENEGSAVIVADLIHSMGSVLCARVSLVPCTLLLHQRTEL